ncbi:hypothetical protein CAP31_09325 [Sulfuriferula sp. AH1]|uniref:tetratricopeptide repeat-containing glycosyltransferase family protein n=1 Tax=Sulfuriferula sp. AH1 TaxID=1985873 RepID=UPI000B3BABFE|nr:tetratricopeptide repeat protein [Sulfuriferula sp. AH1]ARU31854.1 hypothetical protein CAP31_09325 [Sulfuriferula sp. AH1]
MNAHLEAEALFFQGNQHMKAGETIEAEECFRQALLRNPEFAEALTNLGLLREQAGAMEEAEACYRQALAIHPDAQTLLNLGAMLLARKSFAEAEAVNRHALQLAPDSPAAWSNQGVLFACMKREGEAEQCYRTALALNGSYANARFNLSYILLRQGRFEEGWYHLQARKWVDILGKYFTCPQWCGESLIGKSVVIGFEAGHGDMIQFCRYAVMLKERGAAWISLICHPDLTSLFATLPGVDEVHSLQNMPAPKWDVWTLPLSLPHYCHTRLDNIPAPIPYLTADPLKVAKWAALLPASGLRVGLAWKGNPRFENDADRSLPSLAMLAPLGHVSELQFVSLQKGAGEEKATNPPAGLSLLALGSAMTDFADTAAVMSHLDLIITVDTAVAHLAGAMGVKCWLLLPDYRPDWRWLAERTDSPWYPKQMRLFRQPPGGGWPSVIAMLVEALVCWRNERTHREGEFAGNVVPRVR